MYELSRIRLYSIGPAGARYADTVLDLRGVGGPVPSPAPAQADFFEEEPTEPPRRPAPAGVLFLENGGGKSVLLKLIFSVMLPGHRNTLGGASSGVLRKFLLADDCGHVALEWQHTRTGETVVVGKVSEWRGRQVSSDPRKFAEAWYSFRPGPGMSLDSLPVAEAASLRPSHEGASTARGRRRTMKGFRDVLTETGKAYPNLDVAWEEVHERWTERLTGLGLDPELFRYQREMNADEGEAAGLFAVKNDSDFTDLLLRAVTDTRDTDGFADLVHGFAHKLGRRAELTAERDFTAGSLDLLRRIADAAQQRERARDIHAGAEGRARTLVRRLAARGRAERGYSAELAEKAAEAERAVGRAEDTRGRSARITAELAYRHASLALKDAEKSAAAQRRELTEARTLHSAWQAAETVLAHRTAADRAARLSAAIREAERDAAPALAARATAAADLVRALHSAAQQAERTAAEEEDRSAALQTASEDAHRDATAAATEAQRARSESGYLRGRLAEVEQETAEAVRAGWIDPGPDGADGSGPDPDPAAAALAAEDAGRTAGAAWEESRETARRAAERAQEANAELSRAELAAARAEDAAQAATTAHAAERRTAATLGAELRLAELLGLPHAGPAGGAGAGVGAGSGADAATGSAHGRTGTAGRGAATRTTAPAADAGAAGDVGDARTPGAAGDDGDAASAPGGGSSAAAQHRSAGPPEGGMAAASVSAGRAAQAGPGAGGPSPSGDAPAAGPGGGPERPAPEAESGPEHAGAEGGASADARAATAGKAFPASADRSPVVSHKLTPAESPEGWPSAGAPGASATAGPGGSTGPGGSAGHVGSAGPGGPPGPGGSTELGASTGHARSARADSPSPSRDSAAAGPRHDARPGGPHEADASAVPGPRAAAASPARDADDSRARGAEAPFPGGTSGVPGIPAVPEVPGAPGAPGDAALTPEQLDASADALAELLDDAVAACERQLFELRTTAAEDSRMLGALGDGGLLPPSPDVSATVEFLGEHGIPALPGWRYLAQAVDPADHADVLAARPELVDGVVMTDPGSHARAREALSGAALLPRSAVAVGTAAALLAPLPRAGGGGTGGTGGTGDEVFLVPPNPAMHDEHAADEERRQLRTRALARDEEIRALAARLAADRALAARLASWRTGCPTGRLAELAAAARESRTAADAARRRLDEARTARASAEEAAADAARARDERQEQAQRARRAADALAGLASRLRERGAWQTRLRTLADEAAQAEDRAEAALARARAGDEDRRAAQRAADDAHRTARALRAERAQIAGVPDDVDETQPPPEGGSLPALREAYRSAAHLYEKVGVGADLRAEQAHAESDESASRAALDRLSNKVRTRAAQLLDGPDGADGPARQAAAARAEARVQMLESRAAAASEQLGRYRGEAERLAPESGEHHTELPEGMEPADAASAQALLRTANAELAAHTDALTEARTAHAALVRAHRAAEEAADAFTDTAALLRDLLREPQQPAPGGQDADDEPEPYPGGPAEARQAAAEARRSLRGCAADLSAAEQAVREASDVLVRHANSARYEQVRTPARQQIRELPAAALPDHAAAWAEAFAPRLRVLSDELDQLERNRDSIVDRLRGLVESSLATLRSAQRLSRLPEGLGEWSGQEFLRIRFDDPDQAALAERLGEVVDEATRTALAKKSDLRRDGMSLLLRGVHAALLPRGVAVEILKPDAVLRAERVPVGQMGDVFSGGQLLTAAIALYCTMAALRGNDRGHDKDRHAGTLFLDNPIGRANATYLLELQRAVADALGVQLLYTTGLFDTTALAEFPLVIRLRNDADLRAGLKYISVEEHLRPGLPQQPPDEEPVHGEITATRMFRRPPPDPSDASPATP